jgi:hypothetical protein
MLKAFCLIEVFQVFYRLVELSAFSPGQEDQREWFVAL